MRVAAVAKRAIPARWRSPNIPTRGTFGPAATPDQPRFPLVLASEDVLRCAGWRVVMLDSLSAQADGENR